MRTYQYAGVPASTVLVVTVRRWAVNVDVMVRDDVADLLRKNQNHQVSACPKKQY